MAAAVQREYERAAAPVLPKGSDLRVHRPEDLAAVAAELNDRPRKTLGWATPTARLESFLCDDTH
jgi:IS30 family transposase